MPEEMSFGYPSESEIIAALAGDGLEIVPEYSFDFYTQRRQEFWAMLNAMRWAVGLSVWQPSATTINVRGGQYMWKGEVKNYTPGSAIDPTDNDTTYVWLEPDGTVDSGIDGDAWPATEHVKLAEVEVDADGVITDITDLRGQTFLQHLGFGDGSATFTKIAVLTAGSTVQIFNADAPFKFRVIDAWSLAQSADGGTWKLTDGTNDITNAVAVTATDKTVNRVGTIDDDYHEIAAGGSLSVVGDGSLADCIVCIQLMKVV